MNRGDIVHRLSELLGEITDQEPLKLTEQSKPEDVFGWDSTNHVRLVVAIEAELGFRFEIDELTAPDSVGALVDLIEAKLSDNTPARAE